jgi:N-carbamoylputrescine amidase
LNNEIKIAVVQSDPKVGVENIDRNLKESEAWVEKASEDGAELIVFPELNATGYMFENRKEAFAHAQSVERGSIVETWISLCKKKNVYLVGSLVERDGAKLFDTSVLIGPNGYIGKYRKAHLWNTEKLYFSAGDTGFPVFETELGRIGMLICWDTWFPEAFRILALQGADLVCTLNNWVFTPGPLFDESGRCMAAYHTMSAAQVNGLFIAASSRVGEERGAKFLGNSLIVGPTGWPIKHAGIEEESILRADVNLSDARKSHWTELNDIRLDRRKDLYDELLGYRFGDVYPR